MSVFAGMRFKSFEFFCSFPFSWKIREQRGKELVLSFIRNYCRNVLSISKFMDDFVVFYRISFFFSDKKSGFMLCKISDLNFACLS